MRTSLPGKDHPWHARSYTLPFLLNRQKSIAELIKQIKGSSSHVVNQQDLIAEKSAWHTGYAAYAVSGYGVEKVYRYMQHQKQHHARKTSQQEYEEFY